MIRDLSLTLQAILDDPALAADFPELAAAQIAFERPSDTFTPGSTTVDLFLFDIRENTELRSNEPVVTRTGIGELTLEKAPKRIACSYLVTAWASGGGDLALQEHRLLSQALQVLSRYPEIPPSFLRGKLIGQQPDLPVIVAHADGVREPHEFWAAIGNKMRPAFILTTTVSIPVFPAITAPEVISSAIHLDRMEVASGSPARFRFGGQVTDSGGNAVADADVKLVEANLLVRTDADGRYQIGAVAAGTYTLQVKKGAQTKSAGVTLPPSSGDRYDVQL